MPRALLSAHHRECGGEEAPTSSMPYHGATLTALLVLLFWSLSAVWGNTCISSSAQEAVAELAAADAPAVPVQNHQQQQQRQQQQRRPRWAIVSLSKPDKEDTPTRNEALAKHLRPYASKHDITVLFFSELRFPQSTALAYRQSFAGVAAVQFVDTSSRGFGGAGSKERFGYKYMCKFFALDLYDHLQGFDYYMRCDSDCFVKRLGYDLLQWAEDARVHYGFALRKLEAHGPTKRAMPIWTQKYLTRCGLEPTALMDRPLNVAFNFYNNWHIGRVAFFRRPDVRHFLEAVNSSGHILQDRWGDSTIQAYAVRLFMHPRHVLQVPNFSYVHGSHSMRVSTFAGETSDVPQALPSWTPSA